MSAGHATVDLDDTRALLEADHDGLLRSAAMAGAQVRATQAAVDEGALESLGTDQRPRTVIWLSGRGPAEAAGALLTATLSAVASQPVVTAAAVPSWIGPLDVLIVAGDDPGDPHLVSGVATAVRRGARVVVAAPFEGPLRDAAAGRSAVLAPRLWVPYEFGLCRYLAAGLAVLAAVDPAVTTNLAALADGLDAEALRDSPDREVFTNPAKALAGRMSGRPVVLAGDNPATLALARHAGAVLLRIGGRPAASAGLADALAGLQRGARGRFADPVDALFHDEEIDGPLPSRPRVLALALTDERPMLTARLAGFDDIDLLGADDVDVLGADDVGAGGSMPTGGGRDEQQLATLAVRLDIAAVYLGLTGG